MKTISKLTFPILAITLITFSNCSKKSKQPEACFTVSSQTVHVGVTVDFTNCSSESTEHTWKMGDGATSDYFNPSHTYYTPGEYTVVLNAFNTDGESNQTTKTITVFPEPRALQINKITISKWPTQQSDGRPWDAVDPAPDLLPKISTSSRYLFLSTEHYTDCEFGNTYLFGNSAGLPVSVVNFDQNVYVEWYDFNPNSTDQFMGSLKFTPRNEFENNIIRLSDDNWEFSLEVSWLD